MDRIATTAAAVRRSTDQEAHKFAAAMRVLTTMPYVILRFGSPLPPGRTKLRCCTVQRGTCLVRSGLFLSPARCSVGGLVPHT